MQINSVQSNQSFTGLTLKEGAVKAIKNRVSKASEVEEISKLIEAQKANRFNVVVDARHDQRALYGYVNDGSTYHKPFEEGVFAQLFSSPVKFIKKLCKDADEQLQRWNMTSKLDELSEKM